MVGGREMLKGTKGGGLPVFGPDPDMGTRRCYWRLGLYRLDMVLCYQMVDSDLDYEQGGLGEIRCGQLGVSPPPERRRRMHVALFFCTVGGTPGGERMVGPHRLNRGPARWILSSSIC